jgi:hypothetical protein
MRSTEQIDLAEGHRLLSPRIVLALLVGFGPLTFLAAAIKGKRA